MPRSPSVIGSSPIGGATTLSWTDFQTAVSTRPRNVKKALLKSNNSFPRYLPYARSIAPAKTGSVVSSCVEELFFHILHMLLRA